LPPWVPLLGLALLSTIGAGEKHYTIR